MNVDETKEWFSRLDKADRQVVLLNLKAKRIVEIVRNEHTKNRVGVSIVEARVGDVLAGVLTKMKDIPWHAETLSKSKATKLIQQGGIRIWFEKIQDPRHLLTEDDFIHGVCLIHKGDKSVLIAYKKEILI